jgi:hypothetical protein
VAAGEALDVHLVDEGFVPGRARAAVVAPGEGGVDDGGEGREGGVVAVVEGEVVPADAVAEEGVVPLDVAGDGLGVGVEDDLVGVEAVAVPGVVGPVDAVAVNLSGLDVGEVAVPDHVGLLAEYDTGGFFGLADRVKKTEFDLGGVLGEDREVGSGPVPGRALGVGPSGPDSHVVGFFRCA